MGEILSTASTTEIALLAMWAVLTIAIFVVMGFMVRGIIRNKRRNNLDDARAQD